MIAQTKIVELPRSTIRIDALLRRDSASEIKISVLKFKPSFFNWSEPAGVGVSGWAFQVGNFVDLDTMVEKSEHLEAEFSYFLRSCLAQRELAISEGSEAKSSNASNPHDQIKPIRFGLWACHNVHVKAWLHHGREVFLIDLRSDSSKQGYNAEGLYRLGANEQREFFLAIREISEEVQKLKSDFYGLACEATRSAATDKPLPLPFGPSSEVFAVQLQEAKLEIEAITMRRQLINIGPDVIAKIESLFAQHEDCLTDSDLSALELKQARSISTVKDKPTRRVKRSAGKSKPASELNPAVAGGKMPWPIKPGA